MRKDMKPMTTDELAEALNENQGFSEFLATTPSPPKSRIRMRQGAHSFQRTTCEAIDIPDLWSYADDWRSENEGFAIGYIFSKVNVNNPDEMIPTIGRWSTVINTFITHEDAHDWVWSMAQAATSSTDFYKRALAVVAAITIRERGGNG